MARCDDANRDWLLKYGLSRSSQISEKFRIYLVAGGTIRWLLRVVRQRRTYIYEGFVQVYEAVLGLRRLEFQSQSMRKHSQHPCLLAVVEPTRTFVNQIICETVFYNLANRAPFVCLSADEDIVSCR